MKEEFYFSESVTIGHPDKMCDLIADAILDNCLFQDSDSKVACEVMASKEKIIISGEITTRAVVDYRKVCLDVVKYVGYNSSDLEVEVLINTQSKEIADAVLNSYEMREEKSKDILDFQGAGDQGVMYGYACSENENYMPLSFFLARELTNKLTHLRKTKQLDYLLPDGKSQVCLKINNNKVNILNILISTQHKQNVNLKKIRMDIKEKVIDVVFKNYNIEKTEILINPSDSFVEGGFKADCGVTGRKLQVDSYGCVSRQGGGAYSGKDASKVDRSAAYMARYLAKNIVAAKIAKKCEVCLVYAIGKAKPLFFKLNFFNTSKYAEKKIEKIILNLVDLRVKSLIEKLSLNKPIFFNVSKRGHFGNCQDSWEQLDLKEKILEALKM